jgi:hypothetical protein
MTLSTGVNHLAERGVIIGPRCIDHLAVQALLHYVSGARAAIVEEKIIAIDRIAVQVILQCPKETQLLIVGEIEYLLFHQASPVFVVFHPPVELAVALQTIVGVSHNEAPHEMRLPEVENAVVVDQMPVVAQVVHVQGRMSVETVHLVVR